MKMKIALLSIVALLSLSTQIIFAADSPKANIKNSLNVTTSDKELLNEYGVSDQDIGKLEGNAAFIANLIRNKHLSKEQINNVKRSLLVDNSSSSKIESHPVINGMVVDGNIAFPIPHKEKSDGYQAKSDTFIPLSPLKINTIIGDSSSNSSTKNVPDNTSSNVITPSTVTACGTGDGYHYIVRSDTGNNKASGDVTLPWGYAVTQYTTTNPYYPYNEITAQNDIPYMYFGVYPTGSGGADAGIFYTSGIGWRTFVNGFASIDGTNSWANGTTALPTGITLQLVVTELNNAINVTVYREDTWTAVANDTFTRAAANNFVSSGANTRWNSEISFAQHCTDTNNSGYRKDGAYMLGNIWNNVYLYKSSGWYGLWDSAHTSSTSSLPNVNTSVMSITTASINWHYQGSIDYRN